MYYVYEWFIKDTNEIIYVGKGTRNRYKVRKHNKFFNDMINRYDCESRIVKEFSTEKEAFDYEFIRIRELKEIGQCVCNIRDGGFGGSDNWWTDELRKQYSEKNVMKSENQRKRMKEQNPMKNKDIASKNNAQKRRAVIIDGKRYASVKDVMAAYGVCYDVVANWCRKGINQKGEQCRFEDSEQVHFSGKRYNKGGCRPMTYLGVHYESPIDCANELGISVGRLYADLKRGYDIKGNECRYDDDTRNNAFENPFKGKPARPIIVNGVRYNSVEEASLALNIAKTTLYSYLQGKRKSNKYICAYDNQHPSRGKSDN